MVYNVANKRFVLEPFLLALTLLSFKDMMRLSIPFLPRLQCFVSLVVFLSDVNETKLSFSFWGISFLLSPWRELTSGTTCWSWASISLCSSGFLWTSKGRWWPFSCHRFYSSPLEACLTSLSHSHLRFDMFRRLKRSNYSVFLFALAGFYATSDSPLGHNHLAQFFLLC